MIAGNERLADLLAQPVYVVNTQLLLFFPGWIVVAFWSVTSAAVSMFLYKALSPQQRIASLAMNIKQLQQQLITSDASPQELSTLMKSYLALSFKKVVVVFLPSLVSMLPFLLVIPGLALGFAKTDIVHFGYDWMRHWLSSFILFSLATSLLLKYRFHIH